MIRPWKTDDVDSLVKHANNRKIADNMTNGFPHPYLREHGEAFIIFANSDDPVHIFAIEVNGEAVGGIGIHPQHDIYCKNAELGYWLSEAYWGHGIIPEAIAEMIRFAFSTYDIQRIYARPFGSNLASQRVLEKAGFRLEARLKQTIYKNDQYQDELIYSLTRKEFEAKLKIT